MVLIKEEFNKDITLQHDRLLSLIDYDPLTGVMCNKVKRINSKPVGEPLGRVSGNGQIMVHVDGRLYQMHRLIWFYMTGEWPTNLVDHKDRDPTNNVWDNLREADRAQNGHNANMKKNNTSGVTGVWYRENKRSPSVWVAEIFVRGKKICLGCSPDKEVAIKIRQDAEIEYFGEYAAR